MAAPAYAHLLWAADADASCFFIPGNWQHMLEPRSHARLSMPCYTCQVLHAMHSSMTCLCKACLLQQRWLPYQVLPVRSWGVIAWQLGQYKGKGDSGCTVATGLLHKCTCYRLMTMNSTLMYHSCLSKDNHHRSLSPDTLSTTSQHSTTKQAGTMQQIVEAA